MSFTVRPSAVAEIADGEPAEVALENALRKARAVRGEDARELVLGCDTIVSLDEAIYGKPSDASQARATLARLAGRTHEVLSGVALLAAGRERTALARTRVSFRKLDERTLDWYVGTGEWQGRAGGYAIQGAGAALVSSVEGDYENVVGLPLACLLELCPELLEL